MASITHSPLTENLKTDYKFTKTLYWKIASALPIIGIYANYKCTKALHDAFQEARTKKEYAHCLEITKIAKEYCVIGGISNFLATAGIVSLIAVGVLSLSAAAFGLAFFSSCAIKSFYDTFTFASMVKDITNHLDKLS